MSVVYRNEHSYCGPISMLKRLTNGDVVLVFREAMWRGFVTHVDPTTRTSMLRSSDNGETWHSLVTPDPAGGNGTTVTQLSDGALLVSNYHWRCVPMALKAEVEGMPGYMESADLGMATACTGIFTTRSETDGYTWDAPHRAGMAGFHHTLTAGRVVELDDHALLMPVTGSKPDDPTSRSWVARSVDRGHTWAYFAAMAPNPDGVDFHETRIVQTRSGRLIATMRTPKRNFYQSVSDDAGHSWSAPAETPIWCGGSSPGDVLLLQDGRILFTYGHRRPPYGVRACLSEDEGKTWLTADERVLRDDGPDADMGYPSSEQLDDGSILTVYYWHGEDKVRHLVATRWNVD